MTSKASKVRPVVVVPCTPCSDCFSCTTGLESWNSALAARPSETYEIIELQNRIVWELAVGWILWGRGRRKVAFALWGRKHDFNFMAIHSTCFWKNFQYV